MQKLQLLKLIDNNNLIWLSRPISRVHEIKLEGHPNLKSFSLIGSPHIQQLSLRGCRKLKSIEFKNLGALEFPASITNGTQLRRLLLLGVSSLLRFPWHMLERLPEVFYLDQCTERNDSDSGQLSQLWVSDPRFFLSFREFCVDLVRAGRFFQSFYVQVAPCGTNNWQLQHEDLVRPGWWQVAGVGAESVKICGCT